MLLSCRRVFSPESGPGTGIRSDSIIGIGAMIDFGPLLSQPFYFLFGAAAQFGIFVAILIAIMILQKLTK